LTHATFAVSARPLPLAGAGLMSDGIVIYPNELKPDAEHLAQLAEQHRLQEVEGLRRELEQIAARREQLATTKPVAEMVVVDIRTGSPSPI
jgi:hypothetical protein